MEILAFNQNKQADKKQAEKYFNLMRNDQKIKILQNLLIDYKLDYQEKIKNVNQLIFNLTR